MTVEDKRHLMDYCQEPTSRCEAANFDCNQCPQEGEAVEHCRQGQKTIEMLKRPGDP